MWYQTCNYWARTIINAGQAFIIEMRAANLRPQNQKSAQISISICVAASSFQRPMHEMTFLL